MSPFFRGNVRPVKKHPRPWSLNPRLNPDVSKDNARISTVGLSSTATDLGSPVFNHAYATRHSLPEETEEPVVVADLNSEAQPGKAEAAVATEPRTDDIVPETHTAETARVAEPATAGSTADAAAAESAQTQPAATSSTQADGPDHPQETIPTAPSDPAPEPRTLTLPNKGLYVESPIINHFVMHDAVDRHPTVEGGSRLANEIEPDVVGTPAAAGAGLETTEGEVRPTEVFAGSLPAEEGPLPPIDEEDPAAVVENEEPVVVLPEQSEEGASTASGLEVIEEEREPEAAAPGERDAAGADNSGAEAPAVETTNLNLRGGERDVAGRPEVADDADATPEATQEPFDDTDSAEAPFVPRHSMILPAPPPIGDYASTPGTESFAGSSASREGSVLANNEEPLMLDEQLEVSDEFKPGVKTFSGLMGVRTRPVESVSQQS